MDTLIATLIAARSEGLIPLVGVVDQPSLSNPLDSLIARTQDLVDATWRHVSLYMPSWELDEVWDKWGSTDSTYESHVRRWIQRVDWRGCDVGIHNAFGYMGSLSFYQSLPPCAVRLDQFPTLGNLEDLRRHANDLADVAQQSGTKYCIFEHSSPWNQNPTFPLAACKERNAACWEGVSEVGLPADRCGSMNG